MGLVTHTGLWSFMPYTVFMGDIHLDLSVKVQQLTPYEGGWISTSARHKCCLRVFMGSCPLFRAAHMLSQVHKQASFSLTTTCSEGWLSSPDFGISL